MNRTSKYLEIGKFSFGFCFRIPFIDQDCECSWEFTLFKTTQLDRKDTEQGEK